MAKEKGVVILGPAWHSCGSYEVFKRQTQCMRELGYKTYFLAVSPVLQYGNDHPYWGYYYSVTTDLGADFRGHTARSRAFFKHAGFWSALPSLLTSSVAKMRALNAAMMSIPQSLRDFIATHDVDTVICHHYFNIPLARKVTALLPGAQLILETQDLQSRHYKDEKYRHPITKRRSSFDENVRDEMVLSGEADVLIHYNEEEEAAFREHLPHRKHLTVYPAFPRNHGRLSDVGTPDGAFDFLIVASANDPNYRSLVWFLETVWSADLDQKYDLRIAGNVDVLFKMYDSPLQSVYGHRFLGRVDSLFDLYKNARFVLLPVSEGQGISIKTIECLSYGKSVVSTPLAFRGFVERVPANLADEAAKSSQDMREQILACDLALPPRKDQRIVQLYEALFSLEAQTAVYRSLLSR